MSPYLVGSAVATWIAGLAIFLLDLMTAPPRDPADPDRVASWVGLASRLMVSAIAVAAGGLAIYLWKEGGMP